MSAKKLQKIEERIKKIKERLLSIDEMRPGTLTKQYKDPLSKKGAYYQISYTYRMKSRTEYVKPLLVKDIRQQVKTYKEFKKVVNLWIDLSLEHSRLKMKMMNRDISLFA
ncbi:MAG: hypothetical protein FJ264_14090 [Planctomycetes bacterium]|nr:hypothetical protein [Planctomycetota bacterium]MBM4064150.1 hypothetical protein [Planctomycetota bacterium]